MRRRQVHSNGMASLSEIKKQVGVQLAKNPSPSPIKVFKGLYSLYKPFMSLLIISYLFNVFNLFIQLVRPHYYGGVIDIVTRSKDAQEFKETVFSMLIYYLVSNLINRVQAKVRSKISRALNTKLKDQIFKTIIEKDMEFFDRTPQPEVINVLGSGASSLQILLLNELIGPFECIFNLFGTLILIYNISPHLTLALLLLIPPKYLLTYFSQRSHLHHHEQQMTLMNELNTKPYSLIQNILLVKLFSTENKELEKISEKREALTEIEEQTEQRTWKVGFLRGLADQILQLVMIWYGGLMVFEGKLTAGDLSKFSLYCANMLGSTSTIQFKVKRVTQSLFQCEKMLDILNYESKVKLNNANAIKKDVLKGSICVKDVYFSYPSKPSVDVLQDVNITIREGESVAFVGQNGSGKTTINYLIQRLYDAKKGEITIDDVDIKQYDVAWLHRHIGYVSQEPLLLDKTVEENIVYGLDSYSQEQLDKALAISNAQFILDKDRFPEGLKTLLGTNGVKLSGGEKQRIAIARALVRNPRILILDEPTSALDGESEVQVQEAINNLMKERNMTVIVVAHKISCIENCDRIYLFNQGKIMEAGTHSELVKGEGLYTKLFKYQINSKRTVKENFEIEKGM